MNFNQNSSDLQLIWDTFMDFESFKRETDGDLNYFIEQWKKKVDKVQTAGCQYSDLLLGLKLMEKVNLSRESIVSVISKLNSSIPNSEGFLTEVVTNIQKQGELGRSSGKCCAEKTDNTWRNEHGVEIYDELEINSNLVSFFKYPVKFFLEESSSNRLRQNFDEDKVADLDKRKRSESGFLACPVCGKNFILIENLRNHIKNHSNYDDLIYGLEEDSSSEKFYTDSPEFDAQNQKDEAIYQDLFKTEIKSEMIQEYDMNNENGSKTTERSNRRRYSKEHPNGKIPLIPLEKFPCKLCYKSVTKNNMTNHMKTHSFETFKCSICPKRYEKLWMVTKHMEVHKTTKDHKCPYCDNTYKGKDGLKKHLTKMHSKEKSDPEEHSEHTIKKSLNEKVTPKKNLAEKKPRRKLPCEICGKSISEDCMRKHIERTHLAEHFKCDYCSKEFSKLSLLEKHMETHNRRHECSICQKIFKGANNLKLHMETHRTTRDFTCAYCGKKYKTKHVLKEHLNLHTKANPMPCNFCDKIFFNYSLRRLHVRRCHTGEKPYKCDFCEKRFYTSNKKVDHMRTHTGEKPFPCRVCGRFFRETNTLKRHVKNVHKDYKPVGIQ